MPAASALCTALQGLSTVVSTTVNVSRDVAAKREEHVPQGNQTAKVAPVHASALARDHAKQHQTAAEAIEWFLQWSDAERTSVPIMIVAMRAAAAVAQVRDGRRGLGLHRAAATRVATPRPV